VQDRPDAPELLDAVAAHLSGLVSAVERSQRFGLLVAANACAMVARELRAGERPVIEEALRVSALLGPGAAGLEDPCAHRGLRPPADRAELRAAQGRLAQAIRAGELDDRLDQALSVLRQSVAAKLNVAHPGYARSADDER